MLCNPKDTVDTIETAFVIVFANVLKSNPLGNLLTRAKTKIYIGVKSKDFNKNQLLAFDKVILLDDAKDYDKLRAIVVENLVDPSLTRIAITEYRACLFAARLREELGIPGPKIADVTRFTDKHVMKQISMKAGLKVPKYVIFNRNKYNESQKCYITEIEEAIGYPMFIKPIKDTASHNIFDVKTPYDLQNALIEMNKLDGDFEIDECINGTLFTLQGIVVNDQLQFFRCGKYSSPSHKFGPNTPYGLIFEHPESPIYKMMLDYLNRIIDVYGPWQDSPMFCQAYLTTDNQIIMIEVENRKPGNMTVEMLMHQIGINTELVGIDLQLGCSVKLPLYEPMIPYEFYGAWVTYKTLKEIVTKNALPKNIQSKAMVNWLANDGTVPCLSQASSSHSAYVILINKSYEDLERDFRVFNNWEPYILKEE